LKILSFNASPRKEKGMTEALLEVFLGSAEASGAEVERHYVIDLDVKGCRGCFNCWFTTPGRCVHRDDMDWILPKMAEADVLVYGTPVYHYNIIHYLQRMRERTLPLSMPEMYVKDGVTHHPNREPRERPQRRVVVSVCGFPDLVNFNQVRGLFPNAVKILLPASQMLYDEQGRKVLSGFLESVKRAGREIVETGDVSQETREGLIMELSPKSKRRVMERMNRVSAQIEPA
jgi:multimeric flavodoxin WrbA